MEENKVIVMEKRRKIISVLTVFSVILSMMSGLPVMAVEIQNAGVAEDTGIIETEDYDSITVDEEEIKETENDTQSANKAVSGNSWGDICYSGKQATIVSDNNGKLYAVKGTKIYVGDGASSSNPAAIKINKKGIGKVGKTGSTTLATSMFGSAEVSVITPQMSEKKITMSVGDKHQLSLKDSGGDLMSRGIPVAWESDKQSVAQVISGNVVAVGIGSAKIYAYAGGKAFKTSVKVTDKASSTLIVNSVIGKKTKIQGLKKAGKQTYEVSGDGVSIEKGKVISSKTTISSINAKVSDGHSLRIYPESPKISTNSINLKIGERSPILIDDCHELAIWKSKNPCVAVASEYGVAIGQSPGQTVLSTKIAGKKQKITVNVSNELYQYEGEDSGSISKEWIVDNTNGNMGYIGSIYPKGKVVINEVDPSYGSGETIEEEIEHTVTFDLAGGSGTFPSVKIVEGQKISQPSEVPVKDGFNFKGWLKDGVLYDFASPVTKDFVLTASWQVKGIDFSVNLAGIDGDLEDIIEPYPITKKVTSFTIHSPERAGYNFLGWTGSNGDVPELNPVIDIEGMTVEEIEGLHFTANWSDPIEYAITYTLGGGSITGEDTVYTVESDDITLPTPEKRGYEFLGWTGSNGYVPQKSVTIQHGKTGDMDFEANWRLITYSVTYELNGGLNSSSNPSSFDVTSDSFSLSEPTRIGYDFDGWTGSNGSTPQKTITIAQGSIDDRTYTANWTARSDTAYTVKHFKMGLDGSYLNAPDEVDNLTGTTDTTIDAALKSYEGFTASSLQQLTILGDGSASVSYRYSRNKYTVEFTGTEHASVISNDNTKTRTLYYGAQIGTLPTEDDLIIDEGYEFTGWEIVDD